MQLDQPHSEASPVTLVSSGVAPAADAGSTPLVALICVSITLAWSAAGETPVTRLAPVAVLTKRSRPALALTTELVTESSHGAFQAATTGWTETESTGRRRGRYKEVK